VLPGPSTPETSIVAPSNAAPTQPTPPIAPPPSAPTQPAAAAAAPKMPPPQSEAQMKALGRPLGMRAHAPFAAVPGPVTPRECKASCGCNCTQLRKVCVLRSALHFLWWFVIIPQRWELT
jgi:hypothetical protein